MFIGKNESKLNFRRAKTAEEKQKISRGVKLWWDKQGTTDDTANEKLAQRLGFGVGAAGLVTGLGISGYKSRNTDPVLKTMHESFDKLDNMMMLERMAGNKKAKLSIGQKVYKNVGKNAAYVKSGIRNVPLPTNVKAFTAAWVPSATGLLALGAYKAIRDRKKKK
jgi:hypothetical protein